MAQTAMGREDRLAYVKAAATFLPSADDELFEAFDAAECALEDESPDAANLFAAFCALLDAKGIVVATREMSREEKADQKAYEKHVRKHPGRRKVC